MAEACLAREMQKYFEPFIPYNIAGLRSHELQDMRDTPMPGSRECVISSFGTPDASGYFNSVYGWIDPIGRYYSCGYGLHELKAQMIIRANRDLMMGYVSMFGDVNEAVNTLLNPHGERNPSDFLSKKGWCRFQNPELGEPEACMYHLRQLTPEQTDTIYAVAFRYKLQRDPITKKRMDWDKVL